MPKVIFISGASRGIGRSLALFYAKPDVHLILLAKDADKLKDVSVGCEKRGATVQYASIDIQETKKLCEFIHAVDSKTPIDLMIANAGISTTLQPNWLPETKNDIDASLNINLLGTLNTINSVIEKMIERRQGQIAIISSLASMRGLPQSPSYCATKAALRIYGQSLRSWLAPYNIKVNVICPGYVKTDMSDQLIGPKPFLISTKKAATIIASGLKKNKSRIYFPWQLHTLMKLANILPDFIVNPILRKFESYKLNSIKN